MPGPPMAWGVLTQALALLPSGHRIALVRADAGFYETAFLEALERQNKVDPIVKTENG